MIFQYCTPYFTENLHWKLCFTISCELKIFYVGYTITVKLILIHEQNVLHKLWLSPPTFCKIVHSWHDLLVKGVALFGCVRGKDQHAMFSIPVIMECQCVCACTHMHAHVEILHTLVHGLHRTAPSASPSLYCCSHSAFVCGREQVSLTLLYTLWCGTIQFVKCCQYSWPYHLQYKIHVWNAYQHITHV